MFQSTHPHGVRLLSVLPWKYLKSLFQSTHPHGVRPLLAVALIVPEVVSIHAPARGATREDRHDTGKLGGFNPRTRTGCDQTEIGRERETTKSFNPRTRTGCDILRFLVLELLIMFQSTHPHGVRLAGQYRCCAFRRVSIHAPARGATSNRCNYRFLGLFVSIHAPARGATLLSALSNCRLSVSIHAPARGATTSLKR